MKKLFASLLAVSSAAITVAPAHAQVSLIDPVVDQDVLDQQINCPLGEVAYQGSCYPVIQPEVGAPTDQTVIRAAGEVVHECSINNPGTVLLTPGLNPDTGNELMNGFAQISFSQSGETRWELTDLRSTSPAFGQSGSITMDPPPGNGGRFGIGELPSGFEQTRTGAVVQGTGGTFLTRFTVDGVSIGGGPKSLPRGSYSVSAVLSCYQSGSAVQGEF